MKIGDRVRMIRDRFCAEGVVIDAREIEDIEHLATIDRSMVLALLAEGWWQRGIAVRYMFTRDVDGSEAWATAVLIQREGGVWWNLFGNIVELQAVAVQQELAFSASVEGKRVYPD